MFFPMSQQTNIFEGLLKNKKEVALFPGTSDVYQTDDVYTGGATLVLIATILSTNKTTHG